MSRREPLPLPAVIVESHHAGESVSVSLVDRDGELAVEITVDRRAYNCAARHAYLARLRPDMQRQLSDMARQHEGNPEGFAEAVRGYVDQLAANAGDADPVLQGPVLGMAEAEASRF